MRTVHLFRKKILTASICSAGVAFGTLATPVLAQQNAQNVEEIVVTGSFRASLADALNLKRSTTASVDSIVAEDIGDFPDNNLAESMQRVPGVNITRVGGEGAQINVRGLSSDFTRVRINGMETVAAGVAPAGANRGRGFDFNIFASELFSRIDVTKTQSASTDEGSLGATVDLYTGRPLDGDDFVFVTSYQQGYNDQSGNYDPRASALISFKNADSTLGAAFSAAYSKRNIDQQGHNSGRWEPNSNSGANEWANADALPAEVSSAVHPRFPRQLDRNLEPERLGLTGSIQWQPTDRTLITVDAMKADLTSTVTERTLTPISLARTGDTGRQQTSLVDYEYDAARTALMYAQLDGVDVRSEYFQQDWETDFSQYTLAISHEVTDRLRVKALWGKSESEMKVTHESTAIFERFNAPMSYDYRNAETDPLIAYGFDLESPASWQISELRDRPADTTNTNDSAAIDLEFDITDSLTLKIGGSKKEFTFDNNQYTRDRAVLEQTTAGVNLDVPDGCGLTMDNLAVTADLGQVYTPSNNQNPFFIPDLKAVADATGLYTDETCFPLAINNGGDRTVTELSKGYYVQLDWRAEIAGIPFRGDLGVRDVETEQTARGIQNVGELVDVTVERSYSDTLPAINMVIEPLDDVALRFSWAEVMTRPGLGSLTPGGSIDGFNRVVTAGNPQLDPFRADATDVSVEWYFAKEALLSVSWFKKEIESFPLSVREDRPWASLNLPDSLLDSLPATPADTFNYRTSINGEGGELDGWEIQYQQPFTFGPLWLQNFGIKANYTKIDSRVSYGEDATSGETLYGPLNGQSEVSWNGTLWYENDNGFSGRVSVTYRDPYQIAFSSVADHLPDGKGEFNSKVKTVDAALSYQMNEHLKFTLDMLNLTDEPETQVLGEYGLIDTTVTSGRQFYLGAQYSF